MFKELAELAKSTTINLIVSGEADGQLRVIVMPKPAKEGENPALSTPLCLVATPEELDAQFAGILVGYVSARTSLADALSASQTVMEAAKKSAVEEAAKKASAKIKSIPATASTTVSTGSVASEEQDEETNMEEKGSATINAVHSDIELF